MKQEQNSRLYRATESCANESTQDDDPDEVWTLRCEEAKVRDPTRCDLHDLQIHHNDILLVKWLSALVHYTLILLLYLKIT